jgi:uncharacterized protein
MADFSVFGIRNASTETKPPNTTNPHTLALSHPLMDSVPPVPITHLLYLHGFRSSPQSFKAQLVARYVGVHHPETTFWCPQLPPSPKEAMQLLLQGTAYWPAHTAAVIGSSLGGFYASVLSEQKGFSKTVLLNPAVEPARDLAKYIGEQTHWHNPQERFFFQPEYVQELRDLRVAPPVHPLRYWVLLAKGDKVLDWREMQAHYAQTHIYLLESGDHAISDFQVHLPAAMGFLGLGVKGQRSLSGVTGL